MLDAVEREARLLTGIAEWNRDRAGQTAAFAEECMEQVSELFTVMMGRLYYVSHVMDELGEAGTAAALRALISGDVVDDLLDGFEAFNREYHSGGYVPLNLALKGGQVIANSSGRSTRRRWRRSSPPRSSGVPNGCSATTRPCSGGSSWPGRSPSTTSVTSSRP